MSYNRTIAGGAYVTTPFVVMYAPLLSERGRDMPKNGTSAPPAGADGLPPDHHCSGGANAGMEISATGGG